MLSFFLNGRLLPNNSIVLLGDIGEGSSGLYCLTDREQCCSTEARGNRGLWRSPDGVVQANGGILVKDSVPSSSAEGAEQWGQLDYTDV